MKRIICMICSFMLIFSSVGSAEVFAKGIMENYPVTAGENASERMSEEGSSEAVSGEDGSETESSTESESSSEAESSSEGESSSEAESSSESESSSEAESSSEGESSSERESSSEGESSSERESSSESESSSEGESGTEIPSEPVETLRVLLVGNSFTRYTTGGITYTVEKPLEELAEGEGKKIEATTLAHGSARLRYYAGMNDAYMSYHKELITLLVNNEWDYVIFQEHTTVPMTHFDSSTYPAVEKLIQYVNLYQPKAKPLLYAVQGYANGESLKLLDGTTRVLTKPEFQLYVAAACKTLENKLGIEVVPAGMHSNRVNVLYPEIQTTGPDSKHPTYAGYYLAACSIYQKIYGSAPDPGKAVLTNCNLAEDELAKLAGLTADSMTISQKDITLETGKTASVTAAANTHLSSAPVIEYRSFDTNVAAVDVKTGLITAKGGGNTVIVAATPDGLQAFCNVTVKVPISFARSYYMAGIGDTIQILPKTNAKNIKWASSKTSVASIDTDGVVTVSASGRTIITATNSQDASDKDTYTLYVTCATPTGLSASSQGTPADGAVFGNIKVSWKSVSGATGYDVYRSTSASGTYVKIGSASGSSYIDKTAAVNKTFYYKVTAKNAYEECTSPQSVRTRGMIAKAPTLKVSRVSKKYAKLKWAKNTKVTGYQIYRSTKKYSNYKKIATVTKSKTTYTDKKVKKKKTYYYKIRAYKKLDGEIFYGVKSLKVKIKI